MRIVHSVNSLRADHGGPSRSVTALCTALSACGEEVEIVTHRQGDREEEAVMPEASVAVRFVERQPGHNVFLSSRNGFADAVAQAAQPPAVIHDHGLWLPSNHAAAQAARRTGQPLVTSIRGMMSRWSMDQSKLKKRIGWALYQRRDLRSASAFHSTSEEEAEDVRRLGLQQPIALIPNGVDIPEESAERIRAEGPRQALFMSRLHPKKGLLNLIEAWAQVRPAEWRLVIAGPDADGHRAEVERAVRETRLEAEVRFVGSVPDHEKWELYRKSDLFVLPTFSENFGIVAAEALAAGVPVITTKGAPWQELETHACGWWTEIGAAPVAQALTQAVSRSPEELHAMGQRGRALIEERYSWGRVAAEMSGVYAWLLGQGARPDCIV